MKAENELMKRKKELKEAITSGMENIIPGYFFNLVGDRLARMFRLAKRPPWIANAVILAALLFLPGLLVAALTGEVSQWEAPHRQYLGIALVGCLVPIVCHLNIAYNLLPGIRDHVVDSVQDVQTVNAFSVWLRPFWTIQSWIAFLIGVGIPLMAVRITSSLATGKFIGIGLLVIEPVLITMVVAPLYVVLKMLTLPPLTMGYKSELDMSVKRALRIYLYYAIANTVTIALATTLYLATWQMLLTFSPN